MFVKSIVLIVLFVIFSDCLSMKLKDNYGTSEEIIGGTSTINPQLVEEEINSTFIQFLNIHNCSSNNNYSSVHSTLGSKNTKEWGGNCTLEHWHNCSCVDLWGGKYYRVDKNDPEKKKMAQVVGGIFNCTAENEEEMKRIVCLRNGWTVSRCNLLCMAECNRNLLRYWNRYVSHYGECKLKQKNDEFMDLECRVKKLTLFKKLGCPSTKAECDERKLAFIFEQLGCTSTNVS